MASRVKPTDVLGLVSTTGTVEPFIRTASAVVDEHLASTTLSKEMLFQIELYLAAHYATLAGHGDAQVVSVEALSAKETKKMAALGEGFKSTYFGQQAVTLDTTGTLERLSLKRASLSVLPLTDYSGDVQC